MKQPKAVEGTHPHAMGRRFHATTRNTKKGGGTNYRSGKEWLATGGVCASKFAANWDNGVARARSVQRRETREPPRRKRVAEQRRRRGLHGLSELQVPEQELLLRRAVRPRPGALDENGQANADEDTGRQPLTTTP